MREVSLTSKFTLDKLVQTTGDDPVALYEKHVLTNADYSLALHTALSEVSTSFLQEEDAEITRRKMDIAIGKERVPAVIRHLLPESSFKYHSETTYNRKTHEGKTTVSALEGPLKDRISTESSFRVTPGSPRSPGSVYHATNIQVSADLWPISSAAEKALASRCETTKEEICAFTQRWIDSQATLQPEDSE